MIKKIGKIAHILIFEILIGALLSLGSFLLFLKLRGETLEKELTIFDNSVWNTLYSLRSPELTKMMIIFSFLGSGIIIIGVAVVSILLILKNHKLDSLLLTLSLVGSIILDSVLKLSTQRARPDISPLLFLNDSSFPSGHAMNSFVFYINIAYLIYQKYRKKKLSVLILGGAIGLVFVIGVSRVYLGVHYASDILGGYVAGFWWLVTFIVIEKTLDVFKVYKSLKK